MNLSCSFSQVDDMNAFFYFILFSFSFFFFFPFILHSFFFFLLLDHNKQLLPRRLSRLLRDGSGFDLCVLLSLVYEDVLDHTILMEKKRGIWRNGVLYITISTTKQYGSLGVLHTCGRVWQGMGKRHGEKPHTSHTTTGRRDRVQGWLHLHYRSFGRVDWVFFFSVVISFAFVSFSHSLPFFAGQPGYVYRRESIDWILGWCSWAALGICLAVGGNTYIHLYACII